MSKELPPDIDPETRCRLPMPDRSVLTGAAAEIYDQHVAGTSQSLKGLHGPGGIRLHSPNLAEVARPYARYLRFESGLSGDLRELTILIAAREADSNFEWSAHENEARKEGLPEETIEAIRTGGPIDELPDRDAVLIRLGREVLSTHKVSSETYRAAHDLFGTRMLIDIVALMGVYTSTAAILACFDMQLPEGEVPRLPPLEK
ncbi:MAG: carboxymuconolactone decarboxylase family protein [Rhodospirillaceae bacterium]